MRQVRDMSSRIAAKQVCNGEEEELVLRRFPFHEAMTEQAVLTMHANAVRYMFQVVPGRQHLAVLGRFSRKLVKRMQQLSKIEKAK